MTQKTDESCTRCGTVNLNICGWWFLSRARFCPACVAIIETDDIALKAWGIRRVRETSP